MVNRGARDESSSSMYYMAFVGLSKSVKIK